VVNRISIRRAVGLRFLPPKVLRARFFVAPTKKNRIGKYPGLQPIRGGETQPEISK